MSFKTEVAKATAQKLTAELSERIMAILAALSDLPGGGDVGTIVQLFKSSPVKR